jgi:hypothetical protein
MPIKAFVKIATPRIAETKAMAEKAFDHFERSFGEKYPPVTKKLTKDHD